MNQSFSSLVVLSPRRAGFTRAGHGKSLFLPTHSECVFTQPPRDPEHTSPDRQILVGGGGGSRAGLQAGPISRPAHISMMRSPQVEMIIRPEESGSYGVTSKDSAWLPAHVNHCLLMLARTCVYVCKLLLFAQV